MNPEDAIDLSREAIKTCMMVGGPILVASLLIGLIVGVVQAMTQVQDQSVSFVPKVILLVAMIGVCLPWLTEKMMDFAKTSFEKPMTMQGIVTTRAKDYPASNRTATLPIGSVQPAGPTHGRADQITPQSNSPFVLPHYRFSQETKPDIGG